MDVDDPEQLSAVRRSSTSWSSRSNCSSTATGAHIKAAQYPNVAMDSRRFRATIRYWRPEQPGGLAVADIPSEHIASLGGFKHQRVRGTINGAEYTSNLMPAGGGRPAARQSCALVGLASEMLRISRSSSWPPQPRW